eukprot:TRINITY_DN1538_c0_g1_i4.p1 TRINITY_DN1538_c0_g1~~TRINITY_DN1538_c0_g1_i4.p1  ORF type:complete len:493 (+),score=108.74 TRINITY_DN1538_c0_g1_i4:209-1480(+)
MSLTTMLGWATISGLSTALTTLTSQCHGATHHTGKPPDCYVNVGLVTHIAWALVPAILLPFTYSFLVWMGQEAYVAYDASVFFGLSILALPSYAVFISYRRYLEALLRPLPGALLCASGVLALPVLLPIVGILVPAQHTVPVGMIILFTIYSFVVQRHVGHVTGICTVPSFMEMKEYTSLAVPAMLSMMAEWWSSEVLVVSAGRIDTASLTANAVMNNLVTVIYQTSYAVGSSCSVRVGFWLGAGKPKRAKQAVLLHMAVGCFVSLFIIGPLMYNPSQVATLLVGNLDAKTHYLTTRLIPIICCFYFFDTFQASLNGTMCGAGLQHLSFCFTLCSFWPIGIPLALYLGLSCGLGVVGFWYGLSVGLALSMALNVTYICFMLNWENVFSVDRLRKASAVVADLITESTDLLDKRQPRTYGTEQC